MRWSFSRTRISSLPKFVKPRTLREWTSIGALLNGKRKQSRIWEVQRKRQAKRYDMGDESAEEDIQETLVASCRCQGSATESGIQLSETLSESDVVKMAATVSKAFARFHKLTRPEQKETLLRHVDQINLTYALPASLGTAVFASRPSDSLPGATALGKAVAGEWARNVMGFVWEKNRRGGWSSLSRWACQTPIFRLMDRL